MNLLFHSLGFVFFLVNNRQFRRGIFANPKAQCDAAFWFFSGRVDSLIIHRVCKDFSLSHIDLVVCPGFHQAAFRLDPADCSLSLSMGAGFT